MKLFITIIAILVSPLSFSDTAFEIPRSVVVELEDTSTDRVYPLFIKLPRSYSVEDTRTYPVIYLTDALYSFQVASGVTHFPMNSGAMEEVIIVGLSYSKGSSGLVSRVRDYTPVEDTDWKHSTGEANSHLAFVRKAVIPYVEKIYRTRSGARTFVGNSLGGLFGVHILLTQPDTFSSYIIGSPSVWFKDSYILDEPARRPSRPVQIYISVGSLESPTYGEGQDMVAGATGLMKKLTDIKDSRLKLKLSVIEGANHATSFPTTLTHGLYWIYGKK